MSKFTSYDAPVQVGGPVNIPQASAADFGGQIGAAIQTSGALLSDAVAKHKVRQDKRDVVSAHAQLSDFKLERTRAAGEAMRNAGTGAPYVFDEQVVDFDEAFGTFTENMTDIQRQAIAGAADTFRYNTLKTVSDFQAGEIVKADLGNMRAISLGIAGELHDGYRDIASAEADFRQILDASSLSDPANEALMLEQLPIWRASLSNGWLANPVNGREALASGEAAASLTDDEFTAFSDSLIEKTKSETTRASAERQLSVATAIPDVWEKYINGEIKSPEQLNVFKGVIPDDVLAIMQKRVLKMRTPERTPKEQQLRFMELFDEYNQFGLKTNKASGRVSFDGEFEGEDFIRFQNKVAKATEEGYLNNASAMMFYRQTQGALSQAIEKSGTFMDNGSTGYLNWSSLFNRMAESIKDSAEAKGWSPAFQAQVFMAAMPMYDAYRDDPQNSLDDVAAPVRMAKAAANEVIRQKWPALADKEDLADLEIVNGRLVRTDGTGNEEIKIRTENVVTRHQVTIGEDGSSLYWKVVEIDGEKKVVPSSVVEFTEGRRDESRSRLPDGRLDEIEEELLATPPTDGVSLKGYSVDDIEALSGRVFARRLPLNTAGLSPEVIEAYERRQATYDLFNPAPL